MNCFSDDERLVLRKSVYLLLSKRSDELAVRATMDIASGYIPKIWQELTNMEIVRLIVGEIHANSPVPEQQRLT